MIPTKLLLFLIIKIDDFSQAIIIFYYTFSYNKKAISIFSQNKTIVMKMKYSTDL